MDSVIERDATEPSSVSPEGGQPGDKTNDKGGKDTTITLSRADYDRLQRELSETRQSEQFWAQRARGDRQVEEEPAEPGIDTSDLVPETPVKIEGIDEDVFVDQEKWVKAVSAGPAAIKALLKKEGLVTAREAADIAAKVSQRVVEQTTKKIGTDNRLMTAFPELGNKDSELFKATAEEYRSLVEFDPDARRSPATLFAAARAAKAKLEAQAQPRRGRDDDDEYGSEYDRVESGRRDRVRAQDGSGGGRGARGGDDAGDRLGPAQKHVLAMMGVSEESFVKRSQDLGIRRKR